MPTDTKRTKMIHIYSPFRGVYRFEVERELRRVYDDGSHTAVGETLRVQHDVAALASEPLPGGPVTITTYADLQALIALCADDLAAKREAEIAAEEQRQAELRQAALDNEQAKLAALKPVSPNPSGTAS